MIQWFRHKLGAQNVKKGCSETLPSRGFFVLLQLFIQVLKPVWYYTQLPVRFENSYSWLWTTLKENTYMGYNFTGSVWITGLYRIPKAMNYISLVKKTTSLIFVFYLNPVFQRDYVLTGIIKHLKVDLDTHIQSGNLKMPLLLWIFSRYVW